MNGYNLQDAAHNEAVSRERAFAAVFGADSLRQQTALTEWDQSRFRLDLVILALNCPTASPPAE